MQRLFFRNATQRHVVFLCVFLFVSCAVLEAQETEVDEAPSSSSSVRSNAADSAANLRQLLANIRSIVGSPIYRKAKVGLSIYSLDRNKSLFEYNAHEALTPASTTKLFFGYAAMKSLGADYGVATQVVVDGSVGTDSVLNGNVYLVGHGDCLLTGADIESLAERVRRAGIKSVKGDVVADASFFDDVSDRQAYSGDKERMEALPPISALGVNRNIVTVLVSNNGSGVAHVQTIPQSAAFRVAIKNSTVLRPEVEPAPKSKAAKKASALKTRQGTSLQRGSKAAAKNKKSLKGATKKAQTPALRRSAKSGRKHAELVPEYPAYSVSYPVGDMILRRPRHVKPSTHKRGRMMARVTSAVLADGSQEFYVNGIPPRNSTQSFSYEMRKPALAAAGMLLRSLQAEGISVSGKVRDGQAPQQSRLISEVKRPLTELLLPVNKNSDNFVAEHVMKIVGAACCGNKQCNVNAFRTLSQILDSAHVPLDGCALFDGSGLSRRNKTSASTQLNMLRSISEQSFSGVFYNTMAIAGIDGTLHRRMRGTAAEGNVHAKTGTHGNVSALSGYVRTKDGERLCFSMISNGAGVGGFKMLENAVATQLAEFSYKDGTIAVPSLR